MTGLKAHVVHLYPRWVLSKGTTHYFAYLANHSVFLPHFSCNDLIFCNDSKTPKITQLGALAGQVQHMAAQKVGFTPRPIRYGPPNWHVSSLSCIGIYISELSLKRAS